MANQLDSRAKAPRRRRTRQETAALRHFHLGFRFTHKIVARLFGVLLLTVALLTLLVWRLAQGPMDVGFLAGRLEAAINADGAPTRVRIGGMALAWEGFDKGLDSPLDLALRDIAVVDEGGRVLLTVPRASVTLSMGGLLIGRFMPRTLALDGLRLSGTRAADNSFAVDLGTLTEDTGAPTSASPVGPALAELMRPVSGDSLPGGHPLSQLRRVRLTDIGLRVVDRPLAVTWTIEHAEIDLVRRAGGGLGATAAATIRLGQQTATATVSAGSTQDGASIGLRFTLTPLVPADWASAAPAFAGLALFALPIEASGAILVSRDLVSQSGTVTLTAGTGTIQLGTGTMPVKSAMAYLTATPEAMTLENAQLVLPGADGLPDTALSATGTARIGPTRLSATLGLSLDRVAIAHLPRLWPVGVGGGARPWLTENLTAGTAHDGHFDLTLDANSDFSGLELTGISGALDVDDGTVHWLRPAPPAEQVKAHVRFTDVDTVDIDLVSGRQRVGASTPIQLTDGHMHIVGMAVKDQDATIEVRGNGPLGDIVALLKEPRLRLLATHPIDLREPGGDAAIALKIKLPLENKVTLDQVDIEATAQLRQGHLTAVAAGRDLDQATLDIVANKDRLTLKGTGAIGGIAAQIDGLMDFQAGKPTSISQRIAVSAKAGTRQLAAAGLDASDLLTGDALPLSAVWTRQVNGAGALAIEADLTEATLTVAPLAWRKPVGTPAKASARLVLAQDRMTGIEAIAVDGLDLSLRAAARAVDGRIAAIRLDRLTLGHTEIAGSVELPAGGPMVLALTGPTLDFGAKLAEKTPPRDKTKAEPPPGPAWTLNGSFGRILLANDAVAIKVTVDATHDGRVFQSLHVAGAMQPAAPFGVTIVRERGIRQLTATSSDAGAFLRGADMVHTIQGGTLTVRGTYDDSNAAHALTGSLEIAVFRVRGAPALGKLLQAMTLYGLVDVVRGPGLGFATLTAPFALADDVLELKDMRAFSPSLGMTAKGTLNLAAETANLEGTIVPAYFFNSLLGKIPVLGNLFRGEEGGGLFAARYTIRGPLADPTVFVNPLTMLTPGFLRGLYGIF
jgi:hypothetical protein